MSEVRLVTSVCQTETMSPDATTPFHTGHLLRRAQQVHLALWNREVSNEVSSVQFAALSALSRRPGISQADLGWELDLDRSTIADLVDRMVRNGLVGRAQSSEDRRRKVLTVTAAGTRTLDELRPGVDRVEYLLLEGLTPAASRALRNALFTVLTHAVDLEVLHSAATPTR